MFTNRIVRHGGPGFVQNDQGQVVSGHKFAKDFAREADPNVKHWDFRSCYSSDGGPFSNGQMLANRTGAAVTAYSGKVNGIGGDEKVFHPQSERVAKITGTVNEIWGSTAGFAVGCFGKGRRS